MLTTAYLGLYSVFCDKLENVDGFLLANATSPISKPH